MTTTFEDKLDAMHDAWMHQEEQRRLEPHEFSNEATPDDIADEAIRNWEKEHGYDD
jgi:hypothetical protein